MKATRFILVLVLALTAFAVNGHAASDAKVSVEDAVHQSTTVPEHATPPNDPAGPAFVTPEIESPVEAAEEHGQGGLPQLNIGTYPSQIFWLLLTFVAMYVIFSKNTLPSIGAVIDARESKIKGDLDAAQALQEQAEAIRHTYEKGLEQARADAVAAIQGVELAAKKQAADRIDAFRKKSEADINAAEIRMDEVRAKSMDDMTSIAAEVASVAAEKITGIDSDVAHAKAIVESIASKAKAA